VFASLFFGELLVKEVKNMAGNALVETWKNRYAALCDVLGRLVGAQICPSDAAGLLCHWDGGDLHD
jgi:hypothetical protein